MKKHELFHSERHSEDLEFSNFLSLVRKERPTQDQIDSVLSQCSISDNEVIERADEDTKVLCSHREQVTSYNAQLARKFFPSMTAQAVDVAAHIVCAGVVCQLEDQPEAVQAWASNTSFHALQRAEPMLRVMISDDTLPDAPGAIYGAMARIEQLHLGGETSCGIQAISVRLDSDQSVHRLERSVVHTMKQGGSLYKLSTFPLRPCTLISTPVVTDAGEYPELSAWVAKDSKQFEALKEVAVGARAMVNRNISVVNGVTNGASCVVREVVLNPDNTVKAIIVQMDSDGRMQRITRSATATHYHDGRS